jgi:hypothetical protein
MFLGSLRVSACSQGVFRVAELPGGVLCRWEADSDNTATGFVLLELAGPAVRPCTKNGVAHRHLVVPGSCLVVSGHDHTSDRPKAVRVAGAIITEFMQLGEPPETAHKYYA